MNSLFPDHLNVYVKAYMEFQIWTFVIKKVEVVFANLRFVFCRHLVDNLITRNGCIDLRHYINFNFN